MNRTLIKKLTHDLRALETILKTQKDLSPALEQEINYSCDAIRDFLTLQENNNRVSPITKRESIYIEYEINREHHNIISLMSPLLRETKFVTTNQKIPTSSNEILYEELKNIIRNICDDEMFETFLSFFVEREYKINITKPSTLDSSFDYTFYLPYFKDVYIFVQKSNTLETLVSLSHECGHAVGLLSNFNIQGLSNNFIYTEVLSMIFEILSVYFLAENPIYSSYMPNFTKKLWNLFLRRSNLALLESSFLNSINLNDIDYMSLKDIRMKAQKITNISNFRCDYQDIINPNIYTQITYILGYLIAIEVFYIYNHDQTFGKQTLHKIMDIDWTISKKEYLNTLIYDLNLIPGEHIEDFKNWIENQKTGGKQNHENKLSKCMRH